MKQILKISESILNDYRPEHSNFQIEHFIIGSQGGIWAQYRQCLRELSSRHGEVASKINEIKKDNQKIKELQKSFFSFLHKKSISKLHKGLKIKKKALKPKLREYIAFYRLAVNLKRKVGELDDKKIKALEYEMWIEKARKTAVIDLLSVGGLQRSTVEFIASFPKEARRQLIAELRPENRQKLLSILD